MNLCRIALLAVTLACLALALAACGGDDSAGGTATASPRPPTGTALANGSTPGIDECSLVTAAELDQILPGQAFPAGVPTGDYCKFTGTADVVSIGTADLVTPEAAAQSLEGSVSKTTSTKVDGVGDHAYWQTLNNRLAIVIGRLAMVVDVFTGTGDTSQSDEATAIARIAVSRLP